MTAVLPAVLRELRLDLIPDPSLDYWEMQTGIRCPLMNDQADVNGIAQHEIKIAARDPVTTDHSAGLRGAPMRADALTVELSREVVNGTELQIALEDHSDLGGLDIIDDQGTVLDFVAKRHCAAHPYALLPRGLDLVADALARRSHARTGRRTEAR